MLLIDWIIDIVILFVILIMYFKDVVSDFVMFCLGLNGVVNIGFLVILKWIGN